MKDAVHSIRNDNKSVTHKKSHSFDGELSKQEEEEKNNIFGSSDNVNDFKSVSGARRNSPTENVSLAS
jgi:hypothetical protein